MITQFQFNVLFFQEQKVSPDQPPRHIRAVFYHKDERISNEIILVFDSEEEPADRHIEVGFTLIEGEYELGETCVLRLEDVTGMRTALYKEENFELRVYPFD
ncbi:hypothetical protein [Marininema halotolerans]|uniref:Uncharacterized protein n=1 Tax=Marininema halotolerans TaxID=1155944 RepID=A0A1I6R425_9BACL|nr:hypothetical protein [Marininema halotolerans]SFS59374.1 hypothetical protein SAMN05444972_10495 [Marininema halotolerans]